MSMKPRCQNSVGLEKKLRASFRCNVSVLQMEAPCIPPSYSLKKRWVNTTSSSGDQGSCPVDLGNEKGNHRREGRKMSRIPREQGLLCAGTAQTRNNPRTWAKSDEPEWKISRFKASTIEIAMQAAGVSG